MTKNHIHIGVFAPNGTTALGGLPTAAEITWQEELIDTGSFSFTINEADPTYSTALVKVGNIVRFSYGTVSDEWRFAGVIETITAETAGSQATNGRSFKVVGRGARALLENAIVYPAAGSTSTTRAFKTLTPGNVIKTLVNEAKARGAIAEITIPSNIATVDANGAAYLNFIDYEEEVGTNLSEVITKHQELAIDAWVTPSLQLKYANTRGTDRTTGSNPLVLRAARDVGDVSQESSGPVLNTVLVGYGTKSQKFTTKNNTESQGTYGRRETFLALSNTDADTAVTLATRGVFNNSAQPSDALTIELPATDGPQPFIDYGVGDWVLVPGSDPTSYTRYRITSLTISVDENNNIRAVPELGTARASLDQRLQRALKKYDKRSASGNASSTATDTLVGSTTEPGVSMALGNYPLLSNFNIQNPWGATAYDADGVAGIGSQSVIGTAAGATGSNGKALNISTGYPGGVIRDNGASLPVTESLTAGGSSDFSIFVGRLLRHNLSYYDPAYRTWSALGVVPGYFPNVECNGNLWAFLPATGSSSSKATLAFVQPEDPTVRITGHVANFTSTRTATPVNAPLALTNGATYVVGAGVEYMITPGFCGGGETLWAYGNDNTTATPGYDIPSDYQLGTNGWWYTTATYSATSTWNRHSQYYSAANRIPRGTIRQPGCDTSGRLYTIDATNIYQGSDTGVNKWAINTIWNPDHTPVGNLVSITADPSDGTILIAGATKASNVNSSSTLTVPAIWRFNPATTALTLAWVGYKHVGAAGTTFAGYIKPLTSGSGFSWTVSNTGGGAFGGTWNYISTL